MADKAKNVVLNFKMDGQVQYANTLKQINAVMNTAAKEYRNHVAALGEDADATDKLRAEKKKLEIQMDGAQKRTKMLRAEYEAMTKDSKTTTEQLTKMRGRVLDAENAEIKLQKSLERVTEGLSDQVQEVSKAKDNLNELVDEAKLLEAEQKRLISSFELQNAELNENASAADRAEAAQKQYAQQMNLANKVLGNLEKQLNEARQAYGENSVEVKQLETRLNHARIEMSKLGQETEDTGNEMDASKGKIGKLGAGLAGLASALPIAAIGSLAESTKELSTELARLQSNAETWGFTGKVVEDSFKKVAAVSGDTGAAVETVSNLMATSFDDNQLAEAIEYVNGAYIQFSDTLSTEGIADGIQETFAVGEAAGSFAELLERSGMSVEKFNEGLAGAKKKGTETDYVLQTLSKTGVKSFYESYQQSNKALIEANEAEVEHQMALKELGDTLRPLVTDATEFTTKMIEWATGFINTAKESEGFRTKVSEVFNGIKTIIQDVLDVVVPYIKENLDKIKQFWDENGTQIKAAIEVLLPFIKMLFMDFINAVKNVIDGGLNVILGIVKLFSSLLTGDFKGAWEGIKQIFSGAVEAIWGLLQLGFMGKILKIFKAFGGKTTDAVTDIYKKTTGKFDELERKVSAIFGKIKDGMLKPVEKAKAAIGKVIEQIKGLFNFEFKWPKLKMPTFQIKGSMNPVKWLEQGVPKLSVKWNAQGAIFTRPTIFGAYGGQLQGGGEAGPEAALPLNEENLSAIGRGIASTIQGTSGEVVVHVYLDTEEVNTKLAPGMSRKINQNNRINARSQAVVLV
jgi:hypothetical protein